MMPSYVAQFGSFSDSGVAAAAAVAAAAGKDFGQINSVPVRNIDSLSDKRSRRLKQLLRLNHDRYAILYNNLVFHNHNPHHLGSAYFLGVSTEQLDAIYRDTVNREHLEPWPRQPASPGTTKIVLAQYRDYLGKGEYQSAWIDFFEDQVAQSHEDGHEWQLVATRFLFETGPREDANSASIFTSLITGLGHPLIHLGYAYELNSRDVAVEALSLATTGYDANIASLLTRPPSPCHRSPAKPTADLLSVFSQLGKDPSLPIYHSPDAANVDTLLENEAHVDTVISYLNSWTALPSTLSNDSSLVSASASASALFQSQRLAALLLISTSPKLKGHGYDFFFAHVLTTSHAVRVILPNIKHAHQTTLLREWLLFALLTYISQNRPSVDIAAAAAAAAVKSFDPANHDWAYVRKQATEGPYASDAHFVKSCRALIAMGETWGNYQDAKEEGEQGGGLFLNCAIRFVEDFEGWSGFSTEGEGARRYEDRVRDGVHMH